MTVVINAILGRKLYRPELVIEKNTLDLDAEDTWQLRVMRLFTSHEKAQH